MFAGAHELGPLVAKIHTMLLHNSQKSTITLEEGLIKTWRLPVFTALLMAFKASAKTDVLVMLAQLVRCDWSAIKKSFCVWRADSKRLGQTASIGSQSGSTSSHRLVQTCYTVLETEGFFAVFYWWN